MMKPLFLFFILIINTTRVFTIGDHEFDLIYEKGYSAESIATGKNVRILNNATDIFGDPSAMHTIKTYSLGVFHTESLDYAFSYLNLSYVIQAFGGFLGMGVMTEQANSIFLLNTAVNQYGEFIEVGSFEHRKLIARIAYQTSVKNDYSIGGAVNMFYNKIYTINGHTVNVDLGISKKERDDCIGISFLLRNIIPQHIQYSHGVEEKVPAQAILALDYPIEKYTVYFQMKHQIDRLVSASSIAIKHNFTPSLWLSIYYVEDFGITKHSTDSAYGVGSGIYLGKMNLSVAMEPYNFHKNEATFYFSLGLNG